MKKRIGQRGLIERLLNPERARTSRSLFRIGHIFCAAFITLAAGCGISGGGIPPGPGIGPGAGPTGRFVVSGRVQTAVAPYNSVSAAHVTLQTSEGIVVIPSTSVRVDGSFDFSSIPGGRYSLNVAPDNPILQPVNLPFSYDGQGAVQFVVSAPPMGAVTATSISLSASTTAPVVHQDSIIQARLLGSIPPDLAPSWIAFGSTGYLTAVGSVATFSPQAPGSEAIFAISGSVSQAIPFSVPVTPPNETVPPIIIVPPVGAIAGDIGGMPPPPPVVAIPAPNTPPSPGQPPSPPAFVGQKRH